MKREKAGPKTAYGVSYVVTGTWGHTSDTGSMNFHAPTQIAHHPT